MFPYTNTQEPIKYRNDRKWEQQILIKFNKKNQIIGHK